jgi:hypothetical protein
MIQIDIEIKDDSQTNKTCGNLKMNRSPIGGVTLGLSEIG